VYRFFRWFKVLKPRDSKRVPSALLLPMTHNFMVNITHTAAWLGNMHIMGILFENPVTRALMGHSDRLGLFPFEYCCAQIGELIALTFSFFFLPFFQRAYCDTVVSGNNECAEWMIDQQLPCTSEIELLQCHQLVNTYFITGRVYIPCQPRIVTMCSKAPRAAAFALDKHAHVYYRLGKQQVMAIPIYPIVLGWEGITPVLLVLLVHRC
jgi:hypothetical protein